MTQNLRINFLSLIIFGIVFFQLDGLYLLDKSQFPVQFQDAAIVLEILFFFVVYFRKTEYSTQSQQMGKSEKWLFIAPILLGITSAIMGYIRYGQPFILGLRPQRAWIMSMLMYFPLTRVINTKSYSIDQLLKIIDKINAIYFSLLLVQYLLGSKYIILHINANERYGSIRLYAITSFMLISYAWHLVKLLLNTKIYLADYFYVISTLFTFFFITKSRMGMVALICATAIVILRQRFTEKKLLFMSMAVIFLCVFFSTDAGSEILSLAVGSEVATIDNNNALLRDMGRAFFISEVVSSIKTLIFGCGFINTDWNPTLEAVRYSEHLFVADNGIFGLVFMYGLLFLLWVILLYFKYIKKSFEKKNEFGVCIFMVGILGCYSLFPECYQTCIAFPLSCVIFENIC